MKTRISLLAVVGVLIIAGAAFAFAQHGHGGGGRPDGEGGRPPFPHLPRELNLTEAQRAQVTEIMTASRTVMEPLHQRLQALRQQMDAATANGQFDETQVRALATQQSQIMVDVTVEHERIKSRIFSVLTAEQRAQLQQLHANGGRHGGRHGGHDGPPPPSGDNN